jgi:DNA repair exonuclease SbcCD ATPase subunit
MKNKPIIVLIFACICLISLCQLKSYAQSLAELEKAKIEIQTLEERLKIKQKEIENKTEKIKSLNTQITDLEAKRKQAESESSKWQAYAEELEEVLNAKEDTLNLLREIVTEKEDIIQQYKAFIQPIFEKYMQDTSHTFVKIDDKKIVLKACYLLFSRTNPPSRLNVKLEILNGENQQKVDEKRTIIKLASLPDVFDFAEAQAETGKESSKAFLFYYEGSKEISHNLNEGKYLYRLFVEQELVQTFWFDIHKS